MSVQEKFLGQISSITDITDPNGKVLYVPPTNNTNAIIKSIFICNTTSLSVTYSIHAELNGTSATSTNALFFNQVIRGNETVQLDTFISFLGTSNNLIVKTNEAGLVFSAFGGELT